jgi:PleD family two-component response regulator
MLDIDHFKHFNDHFSYAAGDALLVELADLLLQKRAFQRRGLPLRRRRVYAHPAGIHPR